MASIKWQSSEPSPVPDTASGGGLWFAAFSGLLGIILGYVLGGGL